MATVIGSKKRSHKGCSRVTTMFEVSYLRLNVDTSVCNNEVMTESYSKHKEYKFHRIQFVDTLLKIA